MRNTLRRLAAGAGVALALLAAAPAMAAPGVDPQVVTVSANPGTSFTISKVVHTPEIPPIPDVLLAVDTTGSMGGAITDVQTNLHQVVSSIVAAQPTARLGVVSYRDEGDGPELFRVRQDLTFVEADVQTAVDGLSAGGGGDTPEAWVNALYQVGTGAVAWRPGSSRIVVLIGDASSHDPSNGHSLADATAALTAMGARVVAVAVNSGGADGLDAAGQATAVVTATGGQLVTTTGSSDVTTAILTGLHNLPTTVTPQPVCDTGLTVAYDQPSATVPSGTDAHFTETVTVGAHAPQGTTLHCTVGFSLDGGTPGPEFTQTINVAVNDVTAPTATCVPTNNPSGKNIPGSSNPDGYYQVGATDNVDSNPKVYIRDTADASISFGPYAVGTKIKLVQAPGAVQNVKPGTGDINWKVTLRGDAIVVAVDASGNASAPITCRVAPPPM